MCEQKGVEIIEAEACPDHIHMLVMIPPKYSVAQIVGYLKGKSSLMIFDRHANLKYKYGNRHFWCRGYYVDTIGKNKKKINVISNVTSWVINMHTKAREAITGFFSAIINKISSLPGEVWNWLCNVVNKVTSFAADIAVKAREVASNLWNNLVDGIKGLPDKIYSIGSDIVRGIWNGIGDMCGWLWDKISGFCDQIWDNIAGFFGISSPSKLFKKELGFNLVYGLAEGVDGKVKTAVDAVVNSMGHDVMKAAKKSLQLD